MKTQVQQLGDRIQYLRKQRGWTQEYLSEKLDISLNYLSRVERGKENPTINMLLKIAKVLKVEPWELFDFGHQFETKELREYLKRFTDEIKEEKLMEVLKVIRAITR